jgi:hypothetical protein
VSKFEVPTSSKVVKMLCQNFIIEISTRKLRTLAHVRARVSAESRESRRPLRAQGEAATRAWGHLVVKDPSELPHTDPKWRTKSAAAAILRGATRADEDHRVRPPWAVASFPLQGRVEPWVVALAGKTAGVPMVPLWWVAAPPLSSGAYRFTRS